MTKFDYEIDEEYTLEFISIDDAIYYNNNYQEEIDTFIIRDNYILNLVKEIIKDEK